MYARVHRVYKVKMEHLWDCAQCMLGADNASHRNPRQDHNLTFMIVFLNRFAACRKNVHKFKSFIPFLNNTGIYMQQTTTK